LSVDSLVKVAMSMIGLLTMHQASSYRAIKN
jgi:hypothetical protein